MACVVWEVGFWVKANQRGTEDTEEKNEKRVVGETVVKRNALQLKPILHPSRVTVQLDSRQIYLQIFRPDEWLRFG